MALRHRPQFFRPKRHIGSYRFWLYGFNVVLLVVLLTFVSVTCKILHKDRMRLFPLDHSEPLVLYLFLGPFFQILDILTGLLGVWRQKTLLITCYWWLLLVILLFDLIVGVLWIFRWRALHSASGNHFLAALASEYGSPSFCRRWNSVQLELDCCGVYSVNDWNEIEHFCGESLANASRLPQSCCLNVTSAKMTALCRNNSELRTSALTLTTESSGIESGCRDKLIKWLYHQSNIVFLLGVCVVVFLKVVGLVIMRTEIRQLGDEIYARKNRHAILAEPKFSVDVSPFHKLSRREEIDLASGKNGRLRETVGLVGLEEDQCGQTP